MWDILLPILGFFIGVLAAMIGVGGGIFIVPLLTLVYGFSPSMAVGTSLSAIILTAIAATLNYSKQKRINYKIGLLMIIATAPGAIIGAFLTSILSSQVLGIFFGVFLLIVAYQLIIKTGILSRNQIQSNKEEFGKDSYNSKMLISKRQAILGVPLIFLGGVASGLFGVGGGIVIVPILIFFFKVPIHFAVATSMFVMIFTSLSGVGQHFVLGNIDWVFALLIGVGSIIGTQVGAQLSKKISARNLQIIFSIFLFIVAIQMITKFI